MRGLGWLLVAALATACACKQNGGTGPGTGTGSGSGSGTGSAADCDAVGAHVAELYQASAERTKLTPEEVQDNTAMVLAECRATPGRVAGCAQRATSVAQLEACLAPLDDEGSEGLQLSGAAANK